MKKILVLIFLLLSVGIWANGNLNIPYMPSPIIDGKIEEAEWQNASCVTGFQKKGSTYLDTEKSFVYVGYDEKYLYVAYKFYGNNLPVGLENDPEGDYWNDDSLEFLIAKDEKNKIWNQFIINCRGGFVAYSNDPKTSNGKQVGETFGTPIKVNKTSACYISPAFYDENNKEEKFWSGEVAVSWDSFGMHPKAGDKTRFLACRDRLIRGKNLISTSISNISISFFEMNNYFYAVFTDKEPMVQMTDYKYPGDNLVLFNPTDKTKTVFITNTYLKENTERKKENEIILLPGEKKYYYSKDNFEESFFTYKTNVIDKESGLPLLDVKNDIINKDVFSYNISSNGIFTIKINSEGAINFPTTDIKMKFNNLMVLYYNKNIKPGKIETIQFSTQFLPHGDYKLYVNIDGIFNEIIDIKL